MSYDSRCSRARPPPVECVNGSMDLPSVPWAHSSGGSRVVTLKRDPLPVRARPLEDPVTLKKACMIPVNVRVPEVQVRGVPDECEGDGAFVLPSRRSEVNRPPSSNAGSPAGSCAGKGNLVQDDGSERLWPSLHQDPSILIGCGGDTVNGVTGHDERRGPGIPGMLQNRVNARGFSRSSGGQHPWCGYP